VQVAASLAELAAALADVRGRATTLALVPTMGNLHRGHLALVSRARQLADAVAVSIYVNPLQFGPGEDFDAYPRTPGADVDALADAGADLLFTPGEVDVYPRGRQAQTRVEVPALGEILCGASRPGHFAGVTTVVCRLLNLVRPDVAVFGKKDYQQLLLLRLMAADLALGVQIVGAQTVREPDGLALSSRNQYLTAQERARAPALYRTLSDLAGRAGERGAVGSDDEQRAMSGLRAAGFEPEYVSVRRRADLQVPGAGDTQLVVLAAARLGRARLIDNLEFDLAPA